MALRGLNDALGQWQQQPAWKSWVVFEQVNKLWPEIVGAPVADHSRPRRIRQQVLTVAVSHSTWAQSLTMQRLLILKKINPQLSHPLTDIRFSPAEWHAAQETRLPFRALPQRANLDVAPRPSSPQDAFTRWQQRVKALNLCRCPDCLRPTPQQELDLWSCCRFCHTTRHIRS